MKRPIAELLTMEHNAGAESARTQYDREIWQILRRKQGYVTHRIYQDLKEPRQLLVYSEWESKKALDGARQHLQGTPLMRRARAALSAAPPRLIVEIGGPVTSTKGLALPDGAVAARVLIHLVSNGDKWHGQEEKLWRTLSNQTGHLASIVFRGFEEPLLVGSFSHWVDADAFERARVHFDEVVTLGGAEPPSQQLECRLYRPLRD